MDSDSDPDKREGTPPPSPRGLRCFNVVRKGDGEREATSVFHCDSMPVPGQRRNVVGVPVVACYEEIVEETEEAEYYPESDPECSCSDCEEDLYGFEKIPQRPSHVSMEIYKDVTIDVDVEPCNDPTCDVPSFDERALPPMYREHKIIDELLRGGRPRRSSAECKRKVAEEGRSPVYQYTMSPSNISDSTTDSRYQNYALPTSQYQFATRPNQPMQYNMSPTSLQSPMGLSAKNFELKGEKGLFRDPRTRPPAMMNLDEYLSSTGGMYKSLPFPNDVIGCTPTPPISPYPPALDARHGLPFSTRMRHPYWSIDREESAAI